MSQLFFAGAASLFGLADIKTACASIGIVPVFCEAPFMRRYVTINETEPVQFIDAIPEQCAAVPLTEFWISYCIKTGRCCISQKALDSSRSKKYFYGLIAAAGEDSVQIYADRSDALNAIKNGQKIVVKPDGLYSGLGIEVIDNTNADMLDTYISQANAIHTKNMKLMNIENTGCMLTEYIDGTEYSADCFFFKGRISIVRVCRKRVVLINDKPCTVIYQLIQPSAQIEKKLISWTNILFESSNISFAQFDFIESADRIVPIDFAARIGGGLTELMQHTGTNPYADAIKGECHLYKNSKTLTQLNYLSTVNGHITDDHYPLADGYQVVFKHTGDYVISFPSSVGSRTALVIQERDTDVLPDGIEQSLLIDNRWIS